MEFIETLKYHIEKYPKMQVTDLIKLAFQCEFGAGHFISDTAAAYRYFIDEAKITPKTRTVNTVEMLGEKFVRINFASYSESNKFTDDVFNLFLKTANEKCGSADGFIKRLSTIEKHLRNTGSEISLKEVVSEYENGKEIRPVSHSETYRNEYLPHYRVVKREFFDNFARNTLLGKEPYLNGF